MSTKIAFIIILFLFYPFLNTVFPQVISNESKYSVSFNSGGNWRSYNYGLKDLNFNFGVQGEYKINKNVSAVIDAGFDFMHFKEVNSVLIGSPISASTKLAMCKFTAGVNYYIPVQKAKIFFTANLGNYLERIKYPAIGNLLELTEPFDVNWNSRFGFNVGAGFENKLIKKLNWTFLVKYHYIFNRNVDLSYMEIPETNWDMKYLNINLGLKYNF